MDVIVAIELQLLLHRHAARARSGFSTRERRKTPRKDQVLFIDARHIFRQVDRAHREFTPEQDEYLANIVRLHRGDQPRTSWRRASCSRSSSRRASTPTCRASARWPQSRKSKPRAGA